MVSMMKRRKWVSHDNFEFYVACVYWNTYALFRYRAGCPSLLGPSCGSPRGYWMPTPRSFVRRCQVPARRPTHPLTATHHRRNDDCPTHQRQPTLTKFLVCALRVSVRGCPYLWLGSVRHVSCLKPVRQWVSVPTQSAADRCLLCSGAWC